MKEFTKKLIDNYQIRKTRKQKTEFIEFIKEIIPTAKVECKRENFGSRNIVIGDIESAKVIFTAHYDTCAVMPMPNFICPKNIPVYILYALLLCVPIFLIAGIIGYIAGLFIKNPLLVSLISYGVILAEMCLMMFGPANKHTMNDNTSGAAVILETYFSLSEEERKKAAFVLFDNEEVGLLGSSLFAKMHKDQMKEKPLINFDCVSDGDHLMLICKKKASVICGDALKEAFLPIGDKKLSIESTSGVFYPSDQANFPCGIGAAAFHRKPFIGPYLARIHTPRDTVFDEVNIEVFAQFAKRLIGS